MKTFAQIRAAAQQSCNLDILPGVADPTCLWIKHYPVMRDGAKVGTIVEDGRYGAQRLSLVFKPAGLTEYVALALPGDAPLDVGPEVAELLAAKVEITRSGTVEVTR